MRFPWRLPLLAAAVLSQALAGAEPPNLAKLPDWAQASARAAALESPPPGAGAWVLLLRQEVAYQGSGTILVRCLRLVRVLGGKGLEEARLGLGGLQEGACSLKELKGWNLRPDGELVKLGSQDKATFGNTTEASFDTETATVALLPRVVEGSLVAFEALEEWKSLRGLWGASLMELHPVRRWELQVSTQGPLFGSPKEVRAQVRRIGFAPWITTVQEAPEGRLAVTAVPPLPVGEAAIPIGSIVRPFVEVHFLDSQWPTSLTLESWEALGSWYHGVFSPKVLPLASGEPILGPGLPGLQTLWRWFGRELIYKQVYLKPERGNVPESSVEVARKRYGDCKDLACLFLALARRAGFEGYPALARIQKDPIRETDLAAHPRDLFNHAIVALRLEHSLDLPAEVETPSGRYLLVDPTDPFTPLGQLGEAHRDGRLLICLAGSGQWAAVPAGAVLRGDLHIQLTGKADATGALKAEVLLRETGDAWGLRFQAHALNRTQFKAYLETHCLDQALNGGCEVLSLGDPLDLQRPFEVRLRLDAPRAFVLQGADWLFKSPLGLPTLPPPLTQPGKKRQFPVESRGDGHVVFQGSIELPRTVQPVLPEHSQTTSFRSLAWKVAVEPNPAGCTLVFQVEQRLKDAFFPFGQQEKALEAWKQDRSLIRSLLQDGLALRP